MPFRCLHCQKPISIAPEDLGRRLACPHCGGEISLPAAEPAAAEVASPVPFRWWEGSISTLSSIIFHTLLVIVLAVWTYGGSGIGGEGEEVAIGKMPGEELTDGAAVELNVEAAEESAEQIPLDDVLEEVEPAASLVADTSSELLALAAPSASGGMEGSLQFDVAISGSGGGGGDWEGMIQTLRRNGLDIVIVFDSTGSMGGEIREVTSQIERIGTALVKLVPKTRIGLCTYRDLGDDYVVRGLPLTNDIQQVARFLDLVSADGGGDQPEAVHEGLHWATSKNKFNGRARKVILLFGDAPPHAQFLSTCLEIASDFRRQQGGIVSTVTCRSPERLAEFIEIAQVGGGEAFLTTDERQIMTQLMVLVFGSKHRTKVLEAFRMLR